MGDEMKPGETGREGLEAAAETAPKTVAEVSGTAHRRLVDAANGVQGMAAFAAGKAKALGTDVKSSLTAITTRRHDEPVDLSGLSAEEKLLYCRVLVSLARIDGVLDPREIANLYLFASTIGLDPASRATLRGHIAIAQREVTQEGEGAESDALELAHAMYQLLDDEHRVPIMTILLRDLIRLSRADRHVAESERDRIIEIATIVFPENAEKVVQATERLLVTEEEFAAGKITTPQLEAATKDIASKAAAFGAPIAAVSLAGSVSGLGAAGITSGLAALGFGGLLGLSAMVTGIGTVVILGVAVHQGARFVLGANERERERRREHLIQQVIAKHQQAMAELTDDIATLAHRMEEYLTQTTNNESRLSGLRAELSAFQLALASIFRAAGAGRCDGLRITVCG